MYFLSPIVGSALVYSAWALRPKEIGGTPVSVSNLEAFSFVVALMWCDYQGRGCSEICTGSLIAPNVVLTAAHCVRPSLVPFNSEQLSMNVNTLFVLINSNNYLEGERLQGSKLVGVKNIRHGSYGTNIVYPFDGDIALLELKECVSGMEVAKVATQMTEPTAGSCANVTVAGFGRVSNAPDAIREVDGSLRYMTEKQHSFETCRDAYIALAMGDYSGTSPVDSSHLESLVGRSVSKAVLPETLICTGGTSFAKTCHGDSGGPTFSSLPDSTHQIIGVTSFIFDPGFCSLGPSFSTRIAFYAEFILSVLDSAFSVCPNWSVEDSFASWPLEPWTDLSSDFQTSRCNQETEWQCMSLECIDRTKVCDGTAHCLDGSDENFVSSSGVALCPSSTRKLASTNKGCDAAITSLRSAIQSAKTQDTVGDVWDTSASTSACQEASMQCASLVPTELAKYCSQLANFLKWNATSLTISENFGVRFNATCPDDAYMQVRSVGSSAPNASCITSSPSIAILILINLMLLLSN